MPRRANRSRTRCAGTPGAPWPIRPPTPNPKAVRDSTFIADLEAKRLAFEWADVTLLTDDPDKVLGHAAKGHLMSDDLDEALGDPQRELGLVSGFFVPTPKSVARLIDLARRGVAVSIFTNAWDASDVRLVHAAYAKYRRELLGGGVRLFEIKGGLVGIESKNVHDGSLNSGSSGGSVLHAKSLPSTANACSSDRSTSIRALSGSISSRAW